MDTRASFGKKQSKSGNRRRGMASRFRFPHEAGFTNVARVGRSCFGGDGLAKRCRAGGARGVVMTRRFGFVGERLARRAKGTRQTVKLGRAQREVPPLSHLRRPGACI